MNHCVPVKEKLKSKFARRTLWLTVFSAVSSFPTLVVYLLREVLPFFRQVSTIRWVELIFQLNSLFNPLLYWYRNRRLRKATLGLLRCRNKPLACTARLIRQRRYTVASLDVEKVQSEQRGARLLRSESLGTMMCLDTLVKGSERKTHVCSIEGNKRRDIHTTAQPTNCNSSD